MTSYTITIRSTGADMGTHEGATPREAIEAMHRDAGYVSIEAAAAALETTVDALVADCEAAEVTVSDAQTRSLRGEALAAGDYAMAAICDFALDGEIDTNALLGQMIDTSVREDRVVRAASGNGLDADLADCCEGDAETETEHEYWGTHDGSEWRIHLVLDTDRRGTW